MSSNVVKATSPPLKSEAYTDPNVFIVGLKDSNGTANNHSLGLSNAGAKCLINCPSASFVDSDANVQAVPNSGTNPFRDNPFFNAVTFAFPMAGSDASPNSDSTAHFARNDIFDEIHATADLLTSVDDGPLTNALDAFPQGIAHGSTPFVALDTNSHPSFGTNPHFGFIPTDLETLDCDLFADNIPALQFSASSNHSTTFRPAEDKSEYIFVPPADSTFFVNNTDPLNPTLPGFFGTFDSYMFPLKNAEILSDCGADWYAHHLITAYATLSLIHIDVFAGN